MAANRFGQRNMIDVDFSSFDSEVMELIEALALVPIGSSEFRYHLACIIVSQGFGVYPLCERYKQYKLMLREENRRLLKRYADYNRPYSRYEGADFTQQLKLDF